VFLVGGLRGALVLDPGGVVLDPGDSERSQGAKVKTLDGGQMRLVEASRLSTGGRIPVRESQWLFILFIYIQCSVVVL